jgi:CubicO group peptidase (beta-lactamase class C family)
MGDTHTTWLNRLLIIGFLLLPLKLSLANEKNAPVNLDSQVADIMQHFQVPGVAIGIVQNKQVIKAQGYGVKTLGSPLAVDADTIFKIASNTKAFTAAALAILADEGKLKWQGRVRGYLPDFKMYDPWVSEHFNIIDLLTHRSGLGLGAGDLMLWPEPSSFSRQEVIHNLRYLKPTGEFRADYAYDNLLYIVAGEIVPALSGQSWEDFVEQRILRRLNMQHCFAASVSADKQADVATPHGVVNGKLQTIVRKKNPLQANVSAAAGGMQCSLNDMLTWVTVQLNQGKLSHGQTLFSAAQHKMMWTPHTIMPVSARSQRLDNTHFSAYGLGWRINDMNGYLQVHHSGSLAGMYSMVSMFPELDLGFVVLTNQQSSGARSALMYSLMKPYIGDKTTNWINEFSAKRAAAPSTTTSTSVPHNPVLANHVLVDEVTGAYDDPWLGRFFIEAQSSAADSPLQIRSVRVEKLIGLLYSDPEKDKFLVRWVDRSLEADVYASFQRDLKGKVVGMQLIPASSDIDFSYDFQDLNFSKSE